MPIHENVNGFRADLEMFKQKVKKSFRRVVIRKTFAVARRIIDYTPVDTGRAALSWTISFGYPETNADVGLGTWGDMAKDIAKAEAKEKLESLPETMVYEKIYINNTVPYIEVLEHGHSLQAPTGMVRIALLEVGGSF